MILVPFNVSVPKDRQDPHLASKLRDELPGIFNWALEGLVRLRKQTRFTEPAIAHDAMLAYKRESNPAAAYLAEECVASTGRIKTSTLYQRYVHWTNVHGFDALNDAQFGKEVVRAFPKVEKVRISENGERPFAYQGITLPQQSQMMPTPTDFRNDNKQERGPAKAPEAASAPAVVEYPDTDEINAQLRSTAKGGGR